jgi:hypothetical protein
MRQKVQIEWELIEMNDPHPYTLKSYSILTFDANAQIGFNRYFDARVGVWSEK